MTASPAFGSIYRGKTVLVTGHTGFKGAWLAFWLAELGAEVHGFALPEPNAPATYSALGVRSRLASELIADLNVPGTFASYVQKVQPRFVFHLAAQPLVRLSYQDPLGTLQTNMMGTAYVLDALRGLSRPVAGVVVTSDKCYQNREWDYGYREEDAMGGHDPYSASKGACELVVSAYRNSFFSPARLSEHGVAIATGRAGNVVGGGDFADDRIIPDCVRAFRSGAPVLLRNPGAVRPWQHVLEPLAGYLELGARLAGPRAAQFCEGWNFGPPPEQAVTVKEVVTEFMRVWGSGRVESDPAAVRVHEAKLLKLSIDKAISRLGWKPVWGLKDTIHETAAFYRSFEEAQRREGSMMALGRVQIESYRALALARGCLWAQGLDQGFELKESFANV